MIPKGEIQAIPLLLTNKKPFGVLDGTLTTARIHPAHKSSSLGSLVAVKELRKSTIYDEGVKIFFKPSHMHLITVMYAFHRDDTFALMFDLAEGNLNGLWQQCMVSSMDEVQLAWGLLQMISIAKALSSLSGDSNFTSLFRCHGIKPENILWFKGDPPSDHSQTADELGYLKLDLSMSRFGLNFKHHYNPYQAPESANGRVLPTRADTWSLGCVYLEFATWIVMGCEGVQELWHLRGATKPFYKYMAESGPRILRGEIVSWVSLVLESDERCPKVISHLLQYLLNRAAVVDFEERAFAHQFVSDLDKFIDRPDLRLDSGDFPSPNEDQSEEI